MKKISRSAFMWEQQQLRNQIALMYLLRDKLAVITESDQFFQNKTKSALLQELDTVIDYNLEQFYSFRAG